MTNDATTKVLYGTKIPGMVFCHRSKTTIEQLAYRYGETVVSTEIFDASTVVCPQCGAQVGSRCSKKDGTESKTYHSPRVTLVEGDAAAAIRKTFEE